MAIRKIVRIDEDKCNGCGLCIPACPEGALQIIDGKARLVRESYCDGLGACLGECPQGAIIIEEREAEAFDEQAARGHIAQTAGHAGPPARPQPKHAPAFSGCPGAAARSLQLQQPKTNHTATEATHALSGLRNWPVQISLLPVQAPYFEGADVLIAADCVPFALAGFHRQLLDGRALMIGCPKLDDAQFYREKLAHIFRSNNIRSVAIAYMEVPCCLGLVYLTQQALEDSGKSIPVTLFKVGIGGEILDRSEVTAPGVSPARAIGGL